MRRKEKLPELLAPAGSFEALVAAIRAGADAVYVGGKSFGARAYAKNFTEEELERATVYAHLHGVKLYVTLNTLIYDRELPEFSNFVNTLRRIRPDALIMADVGAIAAVRKLAPELEIHASTQLSVHNTEGADEAFNLGCKRVVLARELSLENINSVTDNCLAETEIFLHGALCVSCSGQCLMSSLVGGRSGNRGECAQPCRLPYNGKYPLSLRDLSLADHIEELIDSGVASLKIEGRMKSAEYVYTVTSIYRRLLDEQRSASKDEDRELAKAFSRGGFTDGYFSGKPTSPMTGVRSESDKTETREAEKHDFSPEKIKITASASFRLGEPSVLTLALGEKRISVTGEVPQRAENAPLTKESTAQRLAKMGNTFFALDASDIEIQLDEGINLPPSAINALRRDAVKALEGTENASWTSSEIYALKPTKRGKKLHTGLFLAPETLPKLNDVGFFDIRFVPLFAKDGAKGLANGIYIPPIITDSEMQKAQEELSRLDKSIFKYALVGNISHITLSKKYGLIPIADFRLNISNSIAKREYERLGINDFILSPELTLPMARDIGGGEIVYGRIPLMLTERCFIKENFGCNACGKTSFTDRTGAKFPLMREWEHRNLILNSTPTYMGDKPRELEAAGIGIRHFIFSTESANDANAVISAYKKAAPISGARRVGKR